MYVGSLIIVVYICVIHIEQNATHFTVLTRPKVYCALICQNIENDSKTNPTCELLWCWLVKTGRGACLSTALCHEYLIRLYRASPANCLQSLTSIYNGNLKHFGWQCGTLTLMHCPYCRLAEGKYTVIWCKNTWVRVPAALVYSFSAEIRYLSDASVFQFKSNSCNVHSFYNGNHQLQRVIIISSFIGL